MYSPTGMGPAAAMRRRISSSSGVTCTMPSPPARPLSCLPQRPVPCGVQHEGEADEEQRDRQQLSHGDAAPQQAELDVGLAEEFAGDARHRIAAREGADDEPGTPERAGPDHDPEQGEQHKALERGFVELARMA